MLIPSHLNPAFLEHLKAKSKDENGHMQTLAEHTWLVLSRLTDQYRLRPQLPQLVNDERLWPRIFYGCLLHDFGKAAQGFQERLQENAPKNEWAEGRHRHEVLSLGFIDWLFPSGHPDRTAVICIILAHHKDAGEIWEKYGVNRRNRRQKKRVHWLASQIAEADLSQLYRWLADQSEQWREALGFPSTIEPISLQLSETELSTEQIASSIFTALDESSDYLQQYDDGVADEATIVNDMLYRGLILTADHAASAGTARFPAMPLTREIALRPLDNYTPRSHQLEAGTIIGSVLLISPTGSGKTEAAMLWAARQHENGPVARLFYTLPYQASMNAMYERLLLRFFDKSAEELKAGSCDEVTIQHSRALLRFYQDLMALDEMTPKEAKRRARWQRNLGQLNFQPIRIFSPYQMLKAAYSLKGYEALLVDYTDALFIFDEIHAYEPARLALIITMIEWLRVHYNAHFFIMTATLPPLVKDVLRRALNLTEAQVIVADEEEFERSRRHMVHLLEGNLIGQIVELARVDWAAGQVILICLNRVADAQAVYRSLKRELKLTYQQDIILLHGRFNGGDRTQIEQILLERAGVGKRQPDDPHFIAVATQAVEVSLDVDFDTIYTDPAPLEALLQRFGRVNRGRKHQPDEEPQLCPVYVFQEPSSQGDNPYLPYDEAMVQRSLTVLDAHCAERTIDESQVSAMLKEVYVDEIAAAWQEKYDASAREFRQSILDAMKPFHSAEPWLREKFYEMFDGIDVVPLDLLDAYYDALEAEGYLAASQYIVNISKQQYGEFGGYNRITKATNEENDYVDHIDVPYSEEFGLDLDEVRKAEKAKRHNQ